MLHNDPVVTMISDFFKSDLPSMIKRTIQGGLIASNFSPISEIGGDIDDETKSTGVSMLKISLVSPLVTK